MDVLLLTDGTGLLLTDGTDLLLSPVETVVDDPTPYRTTHYFAAICQYDLDATATYHLDAAVARTYDMEPV